MNNWTTADIVPVSLAIARKKIKAVIENLVLVLS